MRGRSKAGSAKSRRRKSAAPKRSSGTEAARPRSSGAAGQESEVARLERDLNEALEQQTAASEILKIISTSQATVQSALDAVVANAAHLCRALNATIYLRDGDVAVIHAQFGEGGSPIGTRRALNEDWVTGQAILEARTIHVPDLLSASGYRQAKEISLPLGYRTLLAVPLMHDGSGTGAILATRREVNPFTDRQIALLQTFAAQAVIAIESARLLSELRERTDDLSESLEQQTATSEVLRVISNSQGDLKPVFESLLANAVRLCAAKFGLLLLYESNWRFRVVAMSNVPPALAELRKREPIFEVTPQTGLGRAVATKDVVHIADYANEAIYKQRHPAAVALGELGGGKNFPCRSDAKGGGNSRSHSDLSAGSPAVRR